MNLSYSQKNNNVFERGRAYIALGSNHVLGRKKRLNCSLEQFKFLLPPGDMIIF
jgi:hypothetical protein